MCQTLCFLFIALKIFTIQQYMNKIELQNQYKNISRQLLNERNAEGFWSGELSSSALATAVAIAAFKVSNRTEYRDKINDGLQWLFDTINTDGGYGDTRESMSNVSTSLLCYAAISLCTDNEGQRNTFLKKLESYLNNQGIEVSSKSITNAVLDFYGKDFTFSVPILTMLVICNVIDESAFDKIPQLPFEFTVLPSSFYQFLNLQVVSYAIPALVAVGIAIFKGKKRKKPLFRAIRNKAIKPSLKKLSKIMPESGGFLEAIPLTAFVNLCLNYSDTNCPEVVDNGLVFLEKQQRNDGSWPIDTDLSTWVTTLIIKAWGDSEIKNVLKPEEINHLRNHILSLQYKTKHTFNNAIPGGWGWTNYSGSVPDGDDTSGAILALLTLFENTKPEVDAIISGCKWLAALQNRDGGIPTFSKGWGRLPFDNSCADLSGHALLAMHTTLYKLDTFLKEKDKKIILKSINQLLKYLQKSQHENGSWIPLWFGNQKSETMQNPVYGTAKVSTYLADVMWLSVLPEKQKNQVKSMLEKGQKYLADQQNEDGSWGGDKNLAGSIEETSLSICALAGSKYNNLCISGFEWLKKEIANQGIHSKPIGLYFAALWYDEKLYPHIFYTEALRRFLSFVICLQ